MDSSGTTREEEVAVVARPVGVRFHPSEEELVGYYLYNRIRGNLKSFNGTFMIQDYDLYGQEEPWQIWDKFGGPFLDGITVKNLYFFTTLKKHNPASSRFLRSVGSSGGTWHGELSPVGIRMKAKVEGIIDMAEKEEEEDDDKWITAYKKMYNYKNPNSDHNGLWIMQEYSLTVDKKIEDVVLCAIRKSDRAVARNLRKRRRLATALPHAAQEPSSSASSHQLLNDEARLLPQLNPPVFFIEAAPDSESCIGNGFSSGDLVE